MNLSTFFFDRLSRTDSNLAINGKKSIDANFFFPDLIKVFDDENHSLTDLKDISVGSSYEIFPQQEKVVNLSQTEFNSITNVINSLINKEKEIDVDSSCYKLEDVEISKEHFVVNQEKLISLLSQFFNINEIKFDETLVKKVNEEKPIQLTFKNKLNKISVSINPLNILTKTNFEDAEKFLLANKILTDSVYLKHNSLEKIIENETNILSNNEKNTIDAIETEIKKENILETKFAENETSGLLNEFNKKQTLNFENTHDIELSNKEIKSQQLENATSINKISNLYQQIDTENQNQSPDQNENTKFYKIEIVKLNSVKSSDNKISEDALNVDFRKNSTPNVEFDNNTIQNNESFYSSSLKNYKGSDSSNSVAIKNNDFIPITNLLSDLTDEEKKVFKNFQETNEIKSIEFTKNNLSPTNKTNIENKQTQKSQDLNKVEFNYNDITKIVNKHEQLNFKLKNELENQTLNAQIEINISNKNDEQTNSLTDDNASFQKVTGEDENPNIEKIINKETNILESENDSIHENDLDKKQLFQTKESVKINTKIKSTIKENNIKELNLENNKDITTISDNESLDNSNRLEKTYKKQTEQLDIKENVQSKAKIKIEQVELSENNLQDLKTENLTLLTKENDKTETKSTTTKELKIHSNDESEKENNQQNKIEVKETEFKNIKINTEKKDSNEIKKQPNLKSYTNENDEQSINLNKKTSEIIVEQKTEREFNKQTNLNSENENSKPVIQEIKSENEKSTQLYSKSIDKTTEVKNEEKITSQFEKNGNENKNHLQSNNEHTKNEFNQFSFTNNHEFEKVKQSFEPKSFYELSKPIKQEELVTEFSKFIQQGEKQTISFQLTPENLGKVNLIVDLVDNVISTKIEVENEQVKQFIQSNIEQLKNNLQSNGVQLSNINISLADYSQKQNQKVYNEKKKFNSRIEKEETVEETTSPRMKKNLGYNTLEFLA